MQIRAVLVLLCLFAQVVSADDNSTRLLSKLASEAEKKSTVNAYFFWGDGCIHCAKEKDFLYELRTKYPQLKIRDFEVYKSASNFLLFKKATSTLNIANSGVPLLIIGDQYVVGYVDGITKNDIERKVNECSLITCPDQVKQLLDWDFKYEHLPPIKNFSGILSKNITVPFLGEIHLNKSLLPIFTVVMGILDGFNPCAMWVLIFLIGLLLDMKDKRKRWILGGVFIFVSGLVYYLFMLAWLNVILFLGFISWMRIVIGIVALLVGGYSLKEFLYKEYATCKVAGSEHRKEIFQRIKTIIHENNFLLSLIGISILAFTVNLVELACSAGLPATYMQVLILNTLPSWQHYLYILLYIFFFMLDDLFVFLIAMVTLELTGLTNKYTKYSKLISGILMLALGFLLIFKPHWLMFG